MPAMRNRCEDCPYCGGKREIDMNMDERRPAKASVPSECWRPHQWCIEEMRDKALLEPFADGKTRLR